MKRAAALLVVLFAMSGAASAQDAVFVVRHAERADTSPDSPLSAAGRDRAAHLAALLRDAGLTAIYTTEFRRTIETAAPLAAAAHLTATSLPGNETARLVERLRSAGASDRILVVGHSNTVPEILTALGVAPRVTLADAEYDNLFIVFPRAGAAPGVVRLRY